MNDIWIFLCGILCLQTTTGFTFPEAEQIFDHGAPREGRQVVSSPISACPDGSDWCEDVPDYPTVSLDPQVVTVDFIKDKLFGESEKKFVFGDDNSRTTESQIGTRFYDDYESGLTQESRACDHRKSTVFPKKARNVAGAFVFIVNNENYKQSVDIEQCLGEGEPCRNQEDAPSFGSTVCRQKFTTYKMYVINQEGEQVYDTFSLPSACLCHHRSTFAIRNLFAEPVLSLPVCPLEASPLALPNSLPLAPPSPAPQGIRFQERKKRQANGCGGQASYCEEGQVGSAYPSNSVRAALKRNPLITDSLFQQLFQTQCQEENDLRLRSFHIDEEQLCYGRTNIIFPKMAQNIKDEWKFVVNLDNYTQSVEVEECDNSTVEGEPWRQESNDYGVCLYSGATGNNPELTVCRQLYTEHKLLSLTNEGNLEVDSFKLPSACACYVREDFILEFRNGMGDEDSKSDAPALPPGVEENPDSDRVVFG